MSLMLPSIYLPVAVREKVAGGLPARVARNVMGGG
jgi:hypothetical protein